MHVTIREATVDDAEALGRMHWAAWREAYSALLPEGLWTEEAGARRIAGWWRILGTPSEDSPTVIAVRGAEVVGLASAGPSRPDEDAGPPVRDRELLALYVRASEYGTGLAPELLAAVLPEGTAAQLWVFEANPRARAFYAKHGFAPDGGRVVLGADLNHQAEIRLVR